jgi:predicted RecB family nuclease
VELDLSHARGELAAPAEFDLGFADLVARGERHEKEVLESFRQRGLAVVELDFEPGTERAAYDATLEALGRGVDVVYQAVLLSEAPGDAPTILGRPGFSCEGRLAAHPGQPRRDGPGYEVVDAKLARTAKARAILQVAFYSALLAEVQGIEPRWMHLALGHGELASFKSNDFAAYQRQVRRRLVEFIADDHGAYPFSDPYPEPVEHCAICRWRRTCTTRRRDDDDLSLVAGITRRQREELKATGIATRRGLAERHDLPHLPRVGAESLARVQLQARLQVASEEQPQPLYELLDTERDDGGALVPNRGLLALAEPVEGDLFFDIEGSRQYSEDGKEFGLQYLFGIVDTAEVDEEGRPRYYQFWAFDRAGEKRAFEELVDFITDRRKTQYHDRLGVRRDAPATRAPQLPFDGVRNPSGSLALQIDESTHTALRCKSVTTVRPQQAALVVRQLAD